MIRGFLKAKLSVIALRPLEATWVASKEHYHKHENYENG
jgi:hypothetical protein